MLAKLIKSYQVRINSLENDLKKSKASEAQLKEALEMVHLLFKDCPKEWFDNEFRFMNARLLMSRINELIQEG